MKYKNYYNFELGNRDIYSRNDILGMTVQDLLDKELSLSYQYNTIGIPKDDELIASPNTHQYTNANGKLRWRSSSKTTEELLEEERRRRETAQAQYIQTRAQLENMLMPNINQNSQAQSEPIIQSNNELQPVQEFATDVLNKLQSVDDNSQKKSISDEEQLTTQELKKQVEANGVPTGGAISINKTNDKFFNKENNDDFFENERRKRSSILMKINGDLNSNRPDAKLFMDIALAHPKNVPSCNDYEFISSDKVGELNKKYNLQGNKKINFWYDGFEFSKESPTAKRLNNSKEFKDQILSDKNYDSKNKNFKNDKLEIEFSNDKNLQYSFGHMTVLNPKITDDGYIEGMGYDKYNYEYHYKNYQSDKDLNNDIKTIFLNDSATTLQHSQHLKNYFIFVPIRIKLDEEELP